MPESEKLYIVCDNCGEAFDDLAAAKAHEGQLRCSDEPTYEILPESEAL